MYWVSNISSWNYIDIGGHTHGRIDWFEDIRDMGYWWQTAHENGICRSVEKAKRSVEDALTRRCLALAAVYDPQRAYDPPGPDNFSGPDETTGGAAVRRS
jgi:hypothetical protein